MRCNQGFTLIELLIVVGFLVLVAGVTVPQYFRATAQSREEALVTDLEAVRRAIRQYTEDHHGALPGTHGGACSETTFVRHLTRRSDARGNPANNGAFGPYLSAGIPPNPFNGLDTVDVVGTAEMPPPDGMTGWRYLAATGEFRANIAGTAPSGARFTSL